MRTRAPYRPFFILILALIGFGSCKTTKVITTEKVRPISTNRLIKKIDQNSFDYEVLSIKRIACQYEGPGERKSFRANLKSEKDKQLLLTLSKLNVPIARLHLTPDSVKMINYFEKTYHLKDYDFLSDLMNTKLDFEMIQAVISNDAFSFRNDPGSDDFKEFVSYTESGMYVLQSLKKRKLSKFIQEGKEDKIERYLKKMDEEDLIVQRLYIDPINFKIRKVILDDHSNQQKVTIDFSDFEKVDQQLYPGNIDIKFTSPGEDLSMKIKLNNFSTEKDQSFSFNIPDKYIRSK